GGAPPSGGECGGGALPRVAPRPHRRLGGGGVGPPPHARLVLVDAACPRDHRVRRARPEWPARWAGRAGRARQQYQRRQRNSLQNLSHDALLLDCDNYRSQNAVKASCSAATLENPRADAAASTSPNCWASAETLLP